MTPTNEEASSISEREDLPLLPVRMLNEFTYCPRLAYMEWAESEFADSADTVEGRYVHRGVDRPVSRNRGGGLAENGEEKIHHRSLLLSGQGLGLIAKLDLLESESGETVVPVDYKRGKRPHVPKGAWEPERVQVCAQGLILRENGFASDHGILYFSGSRERVQVDFDQALVERTGELIIQMRQTMGEGVTPPPLLDSPKCPSCSLVGICLPDEVNLLRTESGEKLEPRPLIPGRDDALPLYVQTPGAKLRKDGDTIRVFKDEERLAEARWLETSNIAIFGGVQVSTQVIQEACRRGVPVTYLSSGGWLYGITQGMTHKNVDLRRWQYAKAADPDFSLRVARRLVQAKIANCRVLVRRNHPNLPDGILDELRSDQRHAERTKALGTLLGIEGAAANRYFSNFGGMLKDDGFHFEFNGRNRRPPRDPVNALLSFTYSMLAREWVIAIMVVGLDPYLGFYHQPRYGRPSLALDLMEEFRPLIADSTVLTVINTGEVQRDDFIERLGAVALTPDGRGKVLRAFERRMSQEVIHPVFHYRISYRRVLEVQARLFGRYLGGEIPEYPAFTTR